MAAGVMPFEGLRKKSKKRVRKFGFCGAFSRGARHVGQESDCSSQLDIQVS